MNVSHEWLQALVPAGLTPEQLRDLITSRVVTVDELVSLRTDLAPIVVARVVEEAAHPDSDHLHVTKVDMGTGVLLDVVCGASNVTAGKLYPFAPTGTTMPNGLKIVKRKIRGAVSDGMLCSPDELLLGSDHDGIMELDIDVAPGTPFLQAVRAGDTRIVIDVGANRPDLLSHLGVAREVAAATGTPLRLPELTAAGAPSLAIGSASRTDGVAGGVAIRLAEPGLARRFMGVVIRGLKVGPSPEWLVKRLESVGGRSINNVVDASNYLLHELGQPTHAFDLARLAGGVVQVRRAEAGESIVTLDGVTRTLDAEAIVIADAERAQAVAGVMGGRDSEVTEATTDIFLEVANFDPARIRATRKALGLVTDGSYRFERGVDIEVAERAIVRLAGFIVDLAGGTIDGAAVDLREVAPGARRIRLRASRVRQVLGESLSMERITELLSGIGFAADAVTSESAMIAVPSWRIDVVDEIDLVEEVARLHGYDRFPLEIRPFRAGNVPDDLQYLTARAIRDVLVGQGLLEARPTPFVRGGEGFVRVANPLAESEGYLRREVLDSLARRAEDNLSRMLGDLRLFEIGSVFEPRDGRLPREEMHVGVLVMGRRQPRHFTDPRNEAFESWASYGAWDARAFAERLARIAYPTASVSVRPPSSEERSVASVDVAVPVGRAEWIIEADGGAIGVVGRVALDAPVWAAPAWGIEISLGIIDSRDVAPPGSHHRVGAAPARAQVLPFRPLPTTPASEFDLALLVPDGRPARDVEDAIRRAAGELLERLDLFDEYTGAGVEAGHRSLAWRLTFRHPERTLRDKEMEGRRSRILTTLEQELNVRQRTS